VNCRVGYSRIEIKVNCVNERRMKETGKVYLAVDYKTKIALVQSSNQVD
jgi:hypothetical protein